MRPSRSRGVQWQLRSAAADRLIVVASGLIALVGLVQLATAVPPVRQRVPPLDLVAPGLLGGPLVVAAVSVGLIGLAAMLLHRPATGLPVAVLTLTVAALVHLRRGVALPAAVLEAFAAGVLAGRIGRWRWWLSGRSWPPRA
jgi:hypothetical protein